MTVIDIVERSRTTLEWWNILLLDLISFQISKRKFPLNSVEKELNLTDEIDIDDNDDDDDDYDDEENESPLVQLPSLAPSSPKR